ncbi:hypothetical protein B0H11DRAFT_2183648 [Mycena galericulata]|nr:hypothetical protein B0H11DRAFT_2183648 [Mycena galericulata]
MPREAIDDGATGTPFQSVVSGEAALQSGRVEYQSKMHERLPRPAASSQSRDPSARVSTSACFGGTSSTMKALNPGRAAAAHRRWHLHPREARRDKGHRGDFPPAASSISRRQHVEVRIAPPQPTAAGIHIRTEHVATCPALPEPSITASEAEFPYGSFRCQWKAARRTPARVFIRVRYGDTSSSSPASKQSLGIQARPCQSSSRKRIVPCPPHHRPHATHRGISIDEHAIPSLVYVYVASASACPWRPSPLRASSAASARRRTVVRGPYGRLLLFEDKQRGRRIGAQIGIHVYVQDIGQVEGTTAVRRGASTFTTGRTKDTQEKGKQRWKYMKARIGRTLPTSLRSRSRSEILLHVRPSLKWTQDCAWTVRTGQRSRESTASTTEVAARKLISLHHVASCDRPWHPHEHGMPCAKRPALVSAEPASAPKSIGDQCGRPQYRTLATRLAHSSAPSELIVLGWRSRRRGSVATPPERLHSRAWASSSRPRRGDTPHRRYLSSKRTPFLYLHAHQEKSCAGPGDARQRMAAKGKASVNGAGTAKKTAEKKIKGCAKVQGRTESPSIAQYSRPQASVVGCQQATLYEVPSLKQREAQAIEDLECK